MSRYYDVLRRADSERQQKIFAVGPWIEAKAPEVDDHGALDTRIVATRNPTDDLPSTGRDELVGIVQRLFLLPSSKIRVVVMAPADNEPNAGLITCCAAQLLSRLVTQRVCLVDTDFHGRSLYNYFGVATTGPNEVVKAETAIDDCLLRLGHNLWLLTLEQPNGSSARGFSPDKMTAVGQWLREQFTFVLIHSAPLTTCRSALPFAHAADGVVLVIEADRTRRDVAQEAKQTLQSAQIRVLGAVLNNRSFPIPQMIYSRL